jgi:endonuclease III-like uncharacterized protein
MCHAEEVADDPFKLIVATMLLNKTTGRAAIPVFRILMSQWPNPEKMVEGSYIRMCSTLILSFLLFAVPESTLEHLLHPLGLSNIRAKRLIELSRMYISSPPSIQVLHKSRAKGEPPTPISHLPGVGKYAIDSYRIFCVPGEEWKEVRPTDKPLCRYLVSSEYKRIQRSLMYVNRNGNGRSKSIESGRRNTERFSKLMKTTTTSLCTIIVSRLAHQTADLLLSGVFHTKSQTN